MKTITIQNREPRKDINGDIIDAHDGCLECFNGRYWLYGTKYGNSDGYKKSHTYVVYSSPDLQEWTPHGDIVRNLPEAVYFRPYVKHCKNTGKFVLWFNWAKDWRGSDRWSMGDGLVGMHHFAVAVGDLPQGPFHVVNWDEPLSRPSKGDHNLFVDSDNVGYIVYTSVHDHFRIVVERLTADYLHGSGEVSEPIYEGVEAPCMFRRGDFYYVLCGALCCFCPQGAGAQVFRATSPLGPYEARNNINRITTANGPIVERMYPIIIQAQETFVATIHTSNGPEFIWMADRWESAPDGIKGHDLQYWSSPLRFTEGHDIVALLKESEWTVEMKT